MTLIYQYTGMGHVSCGQAPIPDQDILFELVFVECHFIALDLKSIFTYITSS